MPLVFMVFLQEKSVSVSVIFPFLELSKPISLCFFSYVAPQPLDHLSSLPHSPQDVKPPHLMVQQGCCCMLHPLLVLVCMQHKS